MVSLQKFNQSDCMIWDTWSKLTNEEERISITFNCHWTEQQKQKYFKIQRIRLQDMGHVTSIDQLETSILHFYRHFPFGVETQTIRSLIGRFFCHEAHKKNIYIFSFENFSPFSCSLVFLFPWASSFLSLPPSLPLFFSVFICLLSLTFCSIDFIHCTRFCHCLFVYLICLSDYLHTHSLFALTGLKFSSCVNFYWPWAGDSPPVHFHLYQIILRSRLLECPFRDLSLGRG